MKVARIIISNFRNVSSGVLHFEGHTLMVGANNVGKSTVCEALDLVLGPDRLSKTPPIDEFDFHNGRYFEDDGSTPKPLRIEVVLTDLSLSLTSACSSYLEFWNSEERLTLTSG